MRTFLYFILISLVTVSYCQNTETVCHTSADCPGSNTCEENVCVRQDLFPLNAKEVVGTFLSVIINVVLNIGGVGGGAVHIPYIHLLYDSTIQKAVTISYACVFGASLGYIFSTVPIKDATTKRYLINYDVSSFTLPALMIGVGIGSIVTRVLSPLVSAIIIIFVLGYAIMRNAFKFKAVLRRELLEEHGRRIYQGPKSTTSIEEAKPRSVEINAVEPVVLAPPSIQEVMSKNELPDQEQQESVKNFRKRNSLPASTILASQTTFDRTYSRVLSILVRDNVPLAGSQQIDMPVEPIPEVANEDQIEVKVEDESLPLPITIPSRAEFLEAKEQTFPFKKLLGLLVNIVSIVIFGVIRGTKNFKPIFGVQWSVSWDLLWWGLGTLCFVLATIKSIYDVVKSQKEKMEVSYQFTPQEPCLTRPRITAILIRAVVGGFASAVSTLAGAFILSPALTDMGIPAAFAAATTNMIMILSMSSSMLGLLLNGNLSAGEAAWFMLFSCILSMIVTKSLNLYVKKTGKESTVVGMILIGTVVGIMCLISVTMQSMTENLSEHVKFGSI